ncbi:MAG TPA: hypothetical protein VIJ47_06450 [Acidimicrobiales bacterium]
MYLFTRLATLRGNERRTMGWAVEMTGYVNAHSDHTLTLWRTDFGAPVGTVAWSAWVQSQNDLNVGFAALADDDGFFDMVDKGQEFMVAPPMDQLRQAVHGEPTDTPPPIGSVTTVTTAVVANGQYVEAAAWGVEMALLTQEISGLPTMFLIDSYGTFGQVTWLSGAPDLAASDAAGEAINANPDYLKRLGDVGDLFVPASGQRRMATRIA